MRHVPAALRVLLGLTFVAVSLSYFVPFLPEPAPPPAEALAYAGALISAKLLLVVKLVELAAGILLLSNRFVPLALAALAPILVGIVHFHAVLAPGGLPLALGVLVLELALAWLYRDAFAPMLRARAHPASTLSRLYNPAAPARATTRP
jgi:putative oxidoreductase